VPERCSGAFNDKKALLIVMGCKCLLNPVTNPIPVYNHSTYMTIQIFFGEKFWSGKFGFQKEKRLF
jgi:hypothetical protein